VALRPTSGRLRGGWARAAFHVARLLPRSPRDVRYAARLARTLVDGGSPLADAQPWMPYRAVDWLEENVDRSKAVFEYGSGGGTLFLAQRAGELHSVEHDAEWYEATRAALDQAGLDVDYVLVEPSALEGSDIPYGLDSFTSTGAELRGLSYEAYVRTIDRFADASLDLVVIDGRARASCAKRALPKVRDGGHILLDNSDRDEYRPVFELLADHGRVDFEGLTPYERQLSRASAWRIDRLVR
jgi:hypothetical protein